MDISVNRIAYGLQRFLVGGSDPGSSQKFSAPAVLISELRP